MMVVLKVPLKQIFAFRIKVKAEYPEIATNALKALLPFLIYLCVTEFCAVTTIKTIFQNNLT